MIKNKPIELQTERCKEKVDEEMVNFVIWLKRKGNKDNTIANKLKHLKYLYSGTSNILDNEEVESYIMKRFRSSAVQNIAGYAYQDFMKYRGLRYKWRHQYYASAIPFVPTEQDIDLLIAGMNPKYSCYLQLMKEIGCSPLEAYRLTPKEFYLEKQLVTINNPVKRHRTKQYKMSDRLTAMITPFVKSAEHDKIIWNTSYNQMRLYFYAKRKKISKKLNKPVLQRISLKTFRHFKGTMEYHRTKDILHVKEFLRHNTLKSTLIYTHLVEFSDVDYFHCKTASTIEEAKELIEKGFDYITEIDNIKLFRKRK